MTRTKIFVWNQSIIVDQSHLLLESFTEELVSSAAPQFFPDSVLSSLVNFLAEQLNVEDQWEVATSETFYPSFYQNFTVGKLMYFMKNLSKSSKFSYLDSGLYPSITDIVEAIKTTIQETNNYSESSMTVKVYRRKQKLEVYFAKQGSGLAFCSTDLGNVFGSNVVNDFEVMLRKMHLANRLCLLHCPLSLSHVIHRTAWVQFCWRHENPIASMLSFYFEAESWWQYSH